MAYLNLLMLQISKDSIKEFDKFILSNYSSNGNELLDIEQLLKKLTSPITDFVGKQRFKDDGIDYTAYFLGTNYTRIKFTDPNSENPVYINRIPSTQSNESDKTIKKTLKKRFDQIKSKLENNSTIQDPNKPYGKFLFGPQRSKPEPNTDQEQFLFRNIHDYIEGDGFVQPQTKNQLSDLLQKNQYKDIIKKPKTGIGIFRGMLLSETEILNFVSPEELQNVTVPNQTADELPSPFKYQAAPDKKRKKLSSPLIFKPKAQISSWTKDKFVARDFSIRNREDYPNGSYSVVLCSVIKKEEQNNFFDLSAWYKELGGLDNEEEVIALSNVEVQEIIYWKNI